MSCPHTRGDDPKYKANGDNATVLVPIRVGMILIVRPLAQTLQACPHTRGDDPKFF